MASSPEIQQLSLLALQLYRKGEIGEYARLNERLFHLSAGSTGEGDLHFAYKALCAFSREGSLDEAFALLASMRQYRELNTVLQRLREDPDAARVRQDPRWPGVLEDLSRSEAPDNPGQQELPEEVQDRLEEILKEDQQVRWELIQMVSSGEFRGARALQFKEAMDEQNKAHVRFITKLLDTYSWPSPEQVGANGTEAVFLVLQHADVATQVKYMPFVEAAVGKGYLQKAQWAIFVDKVAIDRKLPQIYGSQLSRNEAGVLEVMPTDDMDTLDDRRKEVGLLPLAQYLDLVNKQMNNT